MSKKLVIVESPAKARKIGSFLGDEYVVEASVGHIRDLAKNAISVDPTRNFTPAYEITSDKKKVVAGPSLGIGHPTIYVQGRTVEAACDVLRAPSRLLSSVGERAIHLAMSPIGGTVSGTCSAHVPCSGRKAVASGSCLSIAETWQVADVRVIFNSWVMSGIRNLGRMGGSPLIRPHYKE